MLSFVTPWGIVIALVAYPAYLMLMAAALAVCGVSRTEIAKWALRQADRQRFTDLIRAARGLPATTEPESSSQPAEPPSLSLSP